MRTGLGLFIAIVLITASGARSFAASMAEMAPAVQTAFDQIQRLQKVNDVMTRGPTPPKAGPVVVQVSPQNVPTTPAVCAECVGPRVSDIRYMRCDSRNNYLEQRIESVRQRGGLVSDLLKSGPKADTMLKPVCLRVGLESRFGGNTPTFAGCSPGDAQAHASRVRPCVSENYFALINNSFDLVSRCMSPLMSGSPADQANDVRLAFGMLNVESGMHMNAMSPTGAAGIGQFTSDAIEDVNRNDFPQLRQKLEAMGGSCARLSREILNGQPPMRSSVSRSCDRVSLEKGNPLLNLVYMYAYLARSKKSISVEVVDDRRFGSMFSGLSASEKNRLRTALTIWSHNTGPGGLRVPLMALLNSKYRGSRVTNVDQFLSDLSRAMVDYPHRANSSGARRSETSKYWPAVSTILSRIERNAGGGSCVR